MAESKYYFGNPRVKYLPRLRIRELDRNERTCKSRHDSTEFDDNLSMAFTSSNANVNYPTTLPTDHSTLFEVGGHRGDPVFLNFLTSSINTSGEIRQQAIGSLIQNIYTGTIEPFKEFGLHELEDHVSQFYMTGSKVEDVGLGFTNPLKDKHSIRFELYITEGIELAPESGSAYYYDFVSRDFTEIQPEMRQGASGSRYTPNDYRLFGPTGHMLSSGSYNFSTGSSDLNKVPIPEWMMSANPTVENIQKVLTLKETGSFCMNSDFDASATQLLKLSSKIKYPFVVESALINLPIKAGPGWLNDKTTFRVTDSLGDPGELGRIYSLGGPCVTFAVLNQFSDNMKDVILSASLVPSGDLVPEAYVSITENASKTTRCAKGFQVFGGTAGGYVNSTTSFTGNVTLQAKAGVTNGFISRGVTSRFQDSTISLVNGIGRAQNERSSARSIFGKEHTYKGTALTEPNVNDTWFDTLDNDGIAALGDAPMWVFMKGANSPYVVRPEDNISFLITKHRSSQLTNTAVLAASHDFEITAGKATITLYGSYIQDNKEFINTVDSNDIERSHEELNTVLASKVIGNDPVLDQFQSFAYTSQLSGTYLDYYMTGTLSSISDRGLVLHQFNTREKSELDNPSWSVNLQPPYELLGSFTSVKAYDDREIFYNTLIPSLTDIWIKDGVNPQIIGSRIHFKLDNPNEDPTVSNFDWTRSFPFEPKYNDLPRYQYESLKYNVKDSTTKKVVIAKEAYISFIDVSDVENNDFSERYINDVRPPRQIDVVKVMFGQGDWDTSQETSGSFYGSKSFVNYRYRYRQEVLGVPVNYYTCLSPIVRGWKYGLMSGLSTKSSIVLNPQHHGQFRDMYEQRLNSKFFSIADTNLVSSFKKSFSFVTDSPVTARFVDENGKTTTPEKTDSSNLSLHCTSSLPFFDGISRNRETPNVDYINTSMIKIKDDGLGNLKII